MQSDSVANAQESLRYSCSAQVFEAFGDEATKAFSQETGIEVNTYVSTSSYAVNRLINDFSDIASTTQELFFMYRESGYVQIPFCQDMIVVIAEASCKVDNITTAQLIDIFSKEIMNWKELGGPDSPIIVVVPGKNTGAYINFDKQVMARNEIRYDFMSNPSTMAIEAVKNIPNAIAFIGYGSAKENEGIRVIKIDGLWPWDVKYPFYQAFSFVTKGAPTSPAKTLIDFALSAEGQEIIIRKGMFPIR